MAPLGYAPERVAGLIRRTDASVDDLRSLTSTDPLAADALGAVRLLRLNLEELWLPLLRRIGASEAMATWAEAQLLGLGSAVGSASHDGGSGSDGRWRRFHDRRPLDHLTDDQLLELLRRLDDTVPTDDRGAPLLDEAFDGHRDALASALARRMAADGRFAQAVLRQVPTSPTIALLIAEATALPSRYTSAAFVSITKNVWWEAGHEMDKLGAATGALIDRLLTDPAAALHVLTFDHVRRTLATWPGVDQDRVADLVTTALVHAPRDTPSRYRTGTSVLRGLIDLANDDWIDDGGFDRGMSVGVAASVGTYLPAFIDTVDAQAGWVNTRSSGPDGPIDTTLGRHEELLDFYGAVMRDNTDAQRLLGASLADVTRLALDPSGSAPRSVRIDTVAEYAEFLQRAAANEDAEDTIAAAAQRASMRTAIGAVGLGASLLIAVRGAGSATKLVAERALAEADRFGPGGSLAAGAAGPDYANVARSIVVVEVARQLADDPDRRSRLGLPHPGPGGWAAVADLIDVLDRQAGSEHYDDAVAMRLLDRLEDEVRRLGGGDHLDALLQRPAVHDLTRSGDRTD